jgi:hypothetical protein
MYSLTYVSSASSRFMEGDFERLSIVSERNNQRDDITGALLFKEGTFMQVLEGDEAAVCRTFARIASDPRHQGLITMLRGEIQERQFPKFSMRVEQIDATSVIDPTSDLVKALLAKSLPTAQALQNLRNPSTALLMTFAGVRRAAVIGNQRR